MIARDDALLADYLERYLADIEEGRNADMQEICRERPDLLPALEELLGYVPGRAEPDPWLGRVLAGRYELRGRQGAGGMGLVFRAFDLRLQREVAIKVLEEVWARDPRRRGRFAREAKSLAAFRDPGIVVVHEEELEQHPPFLVLEFVEGLDLLQLITLLRETAGPGSLPSATELLRLLRAQGPCHSLGSYAAARSWAELVAQLGVEMARITGVAHDAGVLHRDLKPSNFMLDLHGRLRLLDFGLARGREDAELTGAQDSIGSPRYMAPELLRGAAPDRGSEIWALGATLYELACLEPPFAGSGAELEKSILHEDATPPHERRSGTPRSLSAIILTCLQKDPARRYSSVHSLRADLERMLRYEPVRARPSIVPRPLRGMRAAWRRHAPPPAILASLGATAMLALLLLGRVFGDELAQAESARRDELVRLHERLPPTLGLERTRALRLADPQRGEHAALLQRLLELDPEAHGVRFLAQQFAREGGDAERAATFESILSRSVGDATWSAWTKAFAALRERHTDPGGAACAAEAALDALGTRPLPMVLQLRLRGLALLEAGRWADVLQLVREVEHANGATAGSMFLEAVSLSALDRDRARSLALLERVAALCPGHLPTIHDRARQLRRLGRAREALDVLAPALRRDPEHVRTLELESLILRDLGDWSALEVRLATWPAHGAERAQLQRAAASLRRGLLATQAEERGREFTAAAQRLQPLTSSADARVRRSALRNLALAQACSTGHPDGDLELLLDRALESPSDDVLFVNVAHALEDSTPSARTVRLLAALMYARRLEEQPGQRELLHGLIDALAPIDPERALHFVVRFAPTGEQDPATREIGAALLGRLPSHSLRASWYRRLARAGVPAASPEPATAGKEHEE